MNCIFSVSAQVCDESLLINHDVRAIETDADIPWELVKHRTYFNPDCESRNLLLVHLVGSLDNPGSTTDFPKLAANHGFHVIVLKYPNLIAAQTACADSEDSNCYEKFRLEIIGGYDLSDEVEVDSTNSILNRTSKLISYLEGEFSEYNWGQYLDSNGDLNWGQMLFSGHSQGGGHAAMLAKYFSIHRALMFASPNDYSSLYDEPAFWLQINSETPYESYYGFNNVQDNVVEFQDQYDIWQDLFPFFSGDTVNVENTPYPYNDSKQLIISRDTTGLAGSHSMMLLDEFVPRNSMNKPIYEDVWKYMLGINVISSNDELLDATAALIYPNPTRSILNVSNLDLSHGLKQAEIFNMRSELIMSFSISNQFVSIDLSSLGEGIYVLKLEFEGGKLEYQRFILTK